MVESLNWGLAKRIAFRFVFIYLLVYLYFPAHMPIWVPLIIFLNDHLFHLNVSTTINGSGDSLFFYLHSFCLIAISVVVTLLWSILDRRRKNYTKLYEWLYFLTRLALGITMCEYGIAKIFPAQFGSEITLYDLAKPLGESSPMGLLWKFMAASRPYTIFTGIAEVVAGICLFIPRLALMGALLNMGIMLNIFMLNLSYDVPVKLFSFHLLLISLFLIGKDVQRILNLLPATTVQLCQRKWANRIAIFLPGILTAYSLITSTYALTQSLSEENHPLRGIWTLEDANMKQMIFEPPYRVAIEESNGEWKLYEIKLDEIKKEIAFDQKVATFKLEGDYLELEGDIKAKSHRKDESSFTLLSRGFHWINEYPFNR